MPTITSDFEENPAEEWWHALDEALQNGAAPLELDVLASEEMADVSAERLDLVLEYAASLPGWHGGPDHAPHPFSVIHE